MHCFLW